MKKLFYPICAALSLMIFCSCTLPKERREVVYVRVFFDAATEREKFFSEAIEISSEAKNKEEVVKKLEESGFERSEEYYETRTCDGLIYGAGYYTTCSVGAGENCVRFIVYPTYVYQSTEEYKNAKYGSFFYEIIKKMEERD